MPWLLLHFWRIFALEIEVQANKYFLLALEMCHTIFSVLPRLLKRNRLPSNCFSPLDSFLFLWTFKILLLFSFLSTNQQIFFLSVFRSLTLTGLGVDFFGFILFGNCSAIWIYMFMCRDFICIQQKESGKVCLLHLPRSRSPLIAIFNYLFFPCSLCTTLMNCKIQQDKYLAL